MFPQLLRVAAAPELMYVMPPVPPAADVPLAAERKAICACALHAAPSTSEATRRTHHLIEEKA
jgi:hypothetical protein